MNNFEVAVETIVEQTSSTLEAEINNLGCDIQMRKDMEQYLQSTHIKNLIQITQRMAHLTSGIDSVKAKSRLLMDKFHNETHPNILQLLAVINKLEERRNNLTARLEKCKAMHWNSIDVFSQVTKEKEEQLRTLIALRDGDDPYANAEWESHPWV